MAVLDGEPFRLRSNRYSSAHWSHSCADRFGGSQDGRRRVQGDRSPRVPPILRHLPEGHVRPDDESEIGREGKTRFDTVDTLPMTLQEAGMKVRKAAGQELPSSAIAVRPAGRARRTDLRPLPRATRAMLAAGRRAPASTSDEGSRQAAGHCAPSCEPAGGRGTRGRGAGQGRGRGSRGTPPRGGTG